MELFAASPFPISKIASLFWVSHPTAFWTPHFLEGWPLPA